MKHINEFGDSRHKAWCIHCGACLGQRPTNRDHAPSRVLLVKPYPENLPVMEVCKSCNAGYSLDEEYLMAFLGAVLSVSTDPDSQVLPKVARILRHNSKLRERIAASRTVDESVTDKSTTFWNPEEERVERVLLKNARGHAYFELGLPMLAPPAQVNFSPLSSLAPATRAAFEAIAPGLDAPWPEVGSRALTRAVLGDDLRPEWVIVQEGVYRYGVTQTHGVTVRIILFEYLAAEVHWTD